MGEQACVPRSRLIYYLKHYFCPWFPWGLLFGACQSWEIMNLFNPLGKIWRLSSPSTISIGSIHVDDFRIAILEVWRVWKGTYFGLSHSLYNLSFPSWFYLHLSFFLSCLHYNDNWWNIYLEYLIQDRKKVLFFWHVVNH